MASRIASRIGGEYCFQSAEQDIGHFGLGGPSQGGDGRLLESDRHLRPQHRQEQVAILGVLDGGTAQELDRGDSFDLRGRVVLDDPTCGLPDTGERLVQVERERVLGPVAGGDETRSAANCQGA